jgi:signal peptidase II
MKTNFRLLFFFIMFSVLIGCDQATKEFARNHLKDKGTISMFHDTFRMVYVENTGAFLSLGADLPKKTGYLIFIGLPLIFLMIFAGYIMINRYKLNLFTFLCYTLILSGGIGNIIDRIMHDMHVSDFMNFGIGNIRTGILNFADFYITLAIVLLLLFSRRKQVQKI